MTRWLRTALIGTAVTLGLFVPAATALAEGVDPNSGSLVWQMPTGD